MDVGRDLHMAKGEGETSYSKNSRLQVHTCNLLNQIPGILSTYISFLPPVLDKAVTEVCEALLGPTMTVCDLGCSSGENTLIFASNVVEAIVCNRHKFGCNPAELQFFHNDLPSNDFNLIFQSLEKFKEMVTLACKGETPPPLYTVGLPGSFYTRLFPRQSVHLFHSAYCLHWRSHFLSGLEGEGGAYQNEGNIYIAKNTPPSTVKLYKGQFQKDMLMFLKLRYEELVLGGQMVLSFPGRENEDVYDGDMNHLWGLLAQSMQSLVEEGCIEKEKLDSFSLPIYGPSLSEVKDVVEQTELYDIKHIKLFELNWDCCDESEGDDVLDHVQSGVNVANTIRAVFEPMLAIHFGESLSLIDAIFKKYAYYVAEHLKTVKTKFAVIVLVLKRR
ncbi:anthranilate O-methyltransferase 3-like [Lolium rigidum]|uniref:anthranilate O-methyltransferase 3-like n=1 Tax=Lolium rigidum TaxID=89674 RepID=UPI001F5C8C8D|nr:anthranilate O-methyltransferase 3-like [Lolium rigidum]